MAGAVSSAADVLGVAGTITTVLSLAALCVLAVFLLARKWLASRKAVVEEAIVTGNDVLLSTTLGTTSVPLDGLSPDQKFGLAERRLNLQFRQWVISYSLALFALLGLLVFLGFIIVFNEDKRFVELDDVGLIALLGKVHPDARHSACVDIADAQRCSRIDPILANLSYNVPTARVEQTLQEIREAGGVTRGQVEELVACGGTMEFRVSDHRLACANGRPIPFVGVPAFGENRTSYSILVFHSTPGSFAGVKNFFRSGERNASVHLLISRTGAVVQLVPFNNVAFHAGSAMNKDSVGVELINWGRLEPHRDGSYRAFNGAKVQDAVQVRAANGEMRYWQPYTAEQVAASKSIARALAAAYPIRSIVGHEEIPPGRNEGDPGPAFPIEEIRDAVRVPHS